MKQPHTKTNAVSFLERFCKLTALSMLLLIGIAGVGYGATPTVTQTITPSVTATVTQTYGVVGPTATPTATINATWKNVMLNKSNVLVTNKVVVNRPVAVRYVTFTVKDELWYEVNGNPDRWYYALLAYAKYKGLTPAQIANALTDKKNWERFKTWMTNHGF